MKFCRNCGSQMEDEAAVCANCGSYTETYSTKAASVTATSTEASTLQIIARVFMIIGCVASAAYFLIPLCWTIPMTIKYWRAVDGGQPVNTGFKVCSLLFVSLIAGILMLCDKDRV